MLTLISSKKIEDAELYKFEIVSDDRFFIFALVAEKEEQFLVELSSLVKEKEIVMREYNYVINSIKRKRGKQYVN